MHWGLGKNKEAPHLIETEKGFTIGFTKIKPIISQYDKLAIYSTNRR